jgi:GNAT superfamily N-acetyltransferase
VRTLRLLDDRLALCQLDAEAEVPDWVWAPGGFVSVTRTPSELSIVCAEERVPRDVRAETGWRAFQLAGPLDLSLVGVLASLLRPLAAAGIAVFTLSTFETDYVLVHEGAVGSATEVLRIAGYEVVGPAGPNEGTEPPVRTATPGDYPTIVELWRATRLHLPSDLEEELERLQGDPDLFLVAVADDRIVGAVLGTFDGRRGWVNRLAVVPHRQGQGYGKLLMAELERRLRARGCRKVNLLVTADNQRVVSFYRRLGYERDELIFMEKELSE